MRSPLTRGMRGKMRWRLRRVRNALRGPLVAFRHIGLRPEDAMLAAYPRSGTNWSTMMLGEILLGHEIDFETAPTPIPMVGAQRRAPELLPGSGRLLRTHELHRRGYPRAIYMVRHPADVVISYHHSLPWLGIVRPPFKEFLRAWTRGTVDGHGTWQQNVEAWLDTLNPVHLVRFEDMKADTEGTVKEMLRFLGIEPDPRRVADAVAHNSIEGMRAKQERVRRNRFAHVPDDVHAIRHGKSGTWQEVLDAEDRELIEASAGCGMKRLGYTFSAGSALPPPETRHVHRARRAPEASRGHLLHQ